MKTRFVAGIQFRLVAMIWLVFAAVSVISGQVHAQAPVWHTGGQKVASGSGTALSVARPDNVSEGDLIVLTFTQQRSAASAASGFSTPSGFTLIRSEQATASNDAPEVVAYYKIATNGEPVNYTSTVTNHGSTPNWRAVATRVTGHDPINPIAAVAVGANSGTTSVNSLALPAFSTDADDSLLVAVRTVRREIINDNPPAGMTTGFNVNGTGSSDGSTNSTALHLV